MLELIYYKDRSFEQNFNTFVDYKDKEITELTNYISAIYEKVLYDNIAVSDSYNYIKNDILLKNIKSLLEKIVNNIFDKNDSDSYYVRSYRIGVSVDGDHVFEDEKDSNKVYILFDVNFFLS